MVAPSFQTVAATCERQMYLSIKKTSPMAPQYAPSLRLRLAPLLLLLQTGFILTSAFYLQIKERVDKNAFRKLYSDFQDVNVMVVLGFGFLSTFLVRYGFSSCGFNVLVTVVATQWGLILDGVEDLWNRGKIKIDLKSVVEAELCAASALVSTGAVLGKTNPVQLTVIALLEVFGFVLNKWLLRTLLNIQTLNVFMLLHIFGALFGLMLTWVTYRTASRQGFEKEKVDKKSGLFSMLGVLFLWMFWPSFNSILVDVRTPRKQLRAVSSTYLALAVSAVTAAAVCLLSNPKGKLNLVQMQSSILAGGVAIGASMSAVHQPWEAMTVGFTAAFVSTVGFKFIKLHLLETFECHDTCAILSSHGLPALLGWLIQLTVHAKDADDHTAAIRFAVFHISVLFVTICVSLSLGVLTGFLLKWKFWRPPQDRKCFDDQAFWEFPNLSKQK